MKAQRIRKLEVPPPLNDVLHGYPNIDEHHAIEQISRDANPSLLMTVTMMMLLDYQQMISQMALCTSPMTMMLILLTHLLTII